MRGYQGTWAIEADRLYLKSLIRSKRVSIGVDDVGIEDLFPGYSGGIFAHWFSGDLRCPRGGLLNYIHGGYLSTYEEDLFITVKRGVVTGERIVRNGTAAPDAQQGYFISAQTLFGV